MFAVAVQQTTATPRLVASYWKQSRRPLASLMLLAPLLASYELGVLLLGRFAERNGADVWLRSTLDTFGFGQYFLLPALTVSLLVAWQYASRQRWDVSALVVVGMLAECVVWSAALLGAAHVAGALLASSTGQPHWTSPPVMAWGLPSLDLATQVVSFVGAGIYEEVLFRLLMLPGMAAGLRMFGVSRFVSRWAAIVGTSLLFAAAHHWGGSAEGLVWASFHFRFAAGIFFGLLFVHRGFGITAGAHAGYDLLAGLA